MKNGGLTGKNGGVTGKNGGLTGKNGGLTGKNGGVAGKNGGLTGKNGGLTSKNGGVTGKNGGLTGKNGDLTGKNGGLTGKNGGLTMEMLVKWDILYISVHEYTPFTMKNGETMMSSNHIRPDDPGAWAVCSDMFWHFLRFLVCHFCYFSMRFPPQRYPLR